MKRFMAAALAAGLATCGAEAQSTGPTARASIGISVSVAPRTAMSGIQDRTFGAGDTRSTDDVCLWMNTSTKGYSVTASGSGDEGAFMMGAGAARRTYRISWSEGDGDAIALTPGAGSPYLRSGAAGPACGAGGANAHMRIGMSAAAPKSPPATGSVSILIAPM